MCYIWAEIAAEHRRKKMSAKEIADLRQELEKFKRILAQISSEIGGAFANLERRVEALENKKPPGKHPIGTLGITR